MAKRKTEKPPKLDPRRSTQSLTTAIHLPRNTWELLRTVAFKRAQRTGGRASVSGLIVELVEKNRDSLETE